MGEREYRTPDVRAIRPKEQFKQSNQSDKDRMPHNDFVSVTIVTYNSGRFIKRCLESVLEQKYDRKEIIVIDNASTDGTVDILEQFEDPCRIVYNSRKSRICGRAEPGDRDLANGSWVLTLNPDVLLLPNFIEALVEAGQLDPGDRLRFAASC